MLIAAFLPEEPETTQLLRAKVTHHVHREILLVQKPLPGVTRIPEAMILIVLLHPHLHVVPLQAVALAEVPEAVASEAVAAASAEAVASAAEEAVEAVPEELDAEADNHITLLYTYTIYF